MLRFDSPHIVYFVLVIFLFAAFPGTVGADGKLIGLRAEKPPLPRVHSAAPAHRKHPNAGAPAATAANTTLQDKPEVPKRAHKGGSVKVNHHNQISTLILKPFY